MLDAVLLARLQFALTVAFHFLFPPLTIGMAWLIVGMLNRYRKTGDPFDRSLARFWVRLFGISFAVGVATGITMEFQFGTNWERYSRFMGDIFGAPLAAEALSAFFLESTFLGVLLLGWNRVSRGVLWFSGLMVAIGSTLSGFWILLANSWQQTPAGYRIVGDRAEMTDWYLAFFNPSMWPRFFHTIDAALMTGSLFVLGVSAWYLLQGRFQVFAARCAKQAMIWFAVAALLQWPLGHWHAQNTGKHQPAKLAAYEAHFESMSRAPMNLIGWPNLEKQRLDFPIQIPGLLSFLSGNDVNHVVIGLKAFPRDEWPPVIPLFFTFRAMVGLGTLFALYALLGLWLLRRGSLLTARPFLWLTILMVPLPFVANNLGWFVTEVGRQPWIVQGLLRTNDAVSVVVPAWQVLATIIAFLGVYALVFAAWALVVGKIIAAGPEEAAGEGASR